MKGSPEKYLKKIGENSAGYPVFTRISKEAAVPSPGKAEKEGITMNRRNFLGGLVSAALSGSAGMGILELSKEKNRHGSGLGYDSQKIGEFIEGQKGSPDTGQIGRESIESLSNSSYFMDEVALYADSYEQEIASVLAFGNKLTQGDPLERSRIAYVTQMLNVRNVPEVIEAELKKLIAGLGFEESRYDASRVSSEGAKGVLQIMPVTWEEYSDDDEDILSLADQTRVAGELFSRSYAYMAKECSDAFLALQTEFFEGNEEAFEKYFLAPVIVNAYNAGMGSMAALIVWFAKTYGSQEKTREMFGANVMLSGYDVYFAMSQKGNEEKAVDTYRKYASTYALKVYGATDCLARHATEINGEVSLPEV